MPRKPLRAIPGVDTVLEQLDDLDLPHPTIVSAIRQHLATLRKADTIPTLDTIVADVRSILNSQERSRLQPVINGTGVIIHTNLGRAPLSDSATDAVAAASRYCTLEFDLNTGKRGGRSAYLKRNLALLCGAESATIVNNNAAALVLILKHICTATRQEVIVSRGELVQIGGGFRIPDILESSGATLREVGTTNRTTVEDYERAVTKQTAMILKVHRSNFFMDGFVESPTTELLAAVAKRKRIPLVEDLGSGAMVPTDSLADIEHEPTPGEILKRGVHLMCCSGDKLCGGPQAGIIAGRKRLVAAIEKEPFYRAVRCDKLVLAAMSATVDDWFRTPQNIPVVRMMSDSVDTLRRRAKCIVKAVGNGCKIVDVQSRIGGGAMPRSTIPSVAIAVEVEGQSAAELARTLRMAHPAVVGYISNHRLFLDLRTILPDQDKALTPALQRVMP
jgi:L-seryl-tRNA(Ser) seleniumtransferase